MRRISLALAPTQFEPNDDSPSTSAGSRPRFSWFGVRGYGSGEAHQSANTAVGMVTSHKQSGVSELKQGVVSGMGSRMADLELEAMRAAGLEAQLKAMLAQHQDSPLRADSGKRYKDGNVKTKGRLIYEAAFDAKAREMGITNPADRRQD